MQRIRRLQTHLMASTFQKSPQNLLKRTLSTHDTSNEQKQDQSVLIEEISGNYLVTLNRPKALNSLNTDMINILTPFYEKIIADKKQCTVIMRGTGSKAFCAGGDVRHLYDLGIAGAEISEITEFFRLEYILDNLLGTLPDYVHNVCLLNGITMGGGVGISVHGRYRIATNNTLFAMPETGIGFYTDVGGSYFLPRLVPNGLGLFLGMNGYRLKGCDVLHAGIANYFVDESNMDAMVHDLLYNNEYKCGVSTPFVVSKYATHPTLLPEFTLQNELESIKKVFNFKDNTCVEDIFRGLELLNSEFGSNTLKQLHSVSPTSLKVVHRALYEGRNRNLRECLDMELDIVSEFMKQKSDFYEGIRAQLVDKDRNPKWNYTSLDEVKSVDNYFPNI